MNLYAYCRSCGIRYPMSKEILTFSRNFNRNTLRFYPVRLRGAEQTPNRRCAPPGPLRTHEQPVLSVVQRYT